MQFSDIDNLCIKTIKLLSVDQVCAADSGHPGAPLGLAPTAHILWRHMRINSKNPNWINRDRFVLSNGHACALLYSLLHLSGFDFSIEDLKQFRQKGSKTPGHPEYILPGVEVTTGPLGQGVADAVGLAIAQANFAATYNRESFTISDNFTYVMLGDGCLQEGIASEACSLAGHLKLGNLIALYDDNKISIDGKTELSFDEDVVKRFEAYGWDTIHVKNGNDDLNGISEAIEKAQKNKDRPTFIKISTTIGHGSLIENTAAVHGTALKPDDLKQLKAALGFDPEKSFVVPQEVYDFYNKEIIERSQHLNNEWNNLFAKYQEKYPQHGQELVRRLNSKLPDNWTDKLPMYKPTDSAMATRKLSQIVLDNIFDTLPELFGGSADLTPSNLTKTQNSIDFQPPSSNLGNYTGRYIRYGVREHGMGGIMNGIAAYGANYKPYGGTFLNFVSYASGAVRLSALSGHGVIWLATHDSIGLGEDGPTHQPIETLTHFRTLPNLHVYRPADGNETSAAFKCAIENEGSPSIICLSRQNLPQLEGSCFNKAQRGGYIIHDVENPDIILVSTGSEVHLCIEAAKQLATKNVKVRVVSLIDFFTFNKQDAEYCLSVLPDNVPILSIEAAATWGWGKYAHECFGIDRFGISGKWPDVYKFFDFTPDGIARRAVKVVDGYKGRKIYSPLTRVLPFMAD